MDNEIIRNWLYLTLNTGFKKAKLHRLYKYFNSSKQIFSAGRDELYSSGILNDKEIDVLLKKDFKNIDELLDILRINSVKILTIESLEYPKMLLSLSDPPLLLYCRGRFIDMNKYVCIASVGTREPDTYGKKCAYEIVGELSKAGFLIVSGMAQGIDAISHTAAIDAGYPTVAFVATGIDVIYPKMNAELNKRILKTGMIVSEYPLGMMPRKYSFLERNRLIAAVSKGMFVAQAGLKSGSAASASYALELGKDIFALPGDITSTLSAEPNRLIKGGAYPVTGAEDIINFYSDKYAQYMDSFKALKYEGENDGTGVKIFSDETENKITFPADLPDEEKVLFVLKKSPSSIDVISSLSKISINDLNMMLLLMEMNGKIRSDNGIYYPI